MKRKKSLIAILIIGIGILFSTIVMAQDPVPKDSLPGSESVWTSLHLESIPPAFIIIAGLLMYFIFRFRIKAADPHAVTKFDFSQWINKNWLNGVIYIIFLLVVWFAHLSFTPQGAFALGMAPNLAIDWIKKEFLKI